MVDEQEETLLRRLRDGDEAGFEQLVKQQTGQVVGLAWRLVGNQQDAEEIAQEAFLRLYRALPDFRGESRLSTWLYRTTTHLAIDHLRRERLKRKWFFFRKDNEEPDPVELAHDPRDNPARQVQSQQAMQSLQKSLQKLSPRQQVIFRLRHFEGLALAEIAGHLGLETGTVKAHLHRAVSHLRQELADVQEEQP
jgi:RNA polymerase sigma-70 factor (ECF subfamily)